MTSNIRENSNEFLPYLAADYYADWKDPRIIKLSESIVKKDSSNKDKAIALYHYIRDNYSYNPYEISFDQSRLRASYFSHQTSGHCVDKANLLIACARHQGIPSRYRFANVRNHIGTEKLHALFNSDVLVFHGFAELYIDHKWIKLTPAFNKELCLKLNVDTMDFNGKDHTVYQQYSKDGDAFMEYLFDHGSFATLPFEKIKQGMLDAYPHLVEHYDTKDYKIIVD